MNEIEHEGKTYILKSQVESIVKERVQKVAARATEFETQLNQLQQEHEKAVKANATVDILQNQIKELEAANSKANQRFDRYTSISSYGLTDPDIVEAIEWAFDRSMSKTEEDNRVDLSTWLKSCFENPDNAPVILQPHITAARSSSEASQPVDGAVNGEQIQQEQPQIQNQQIAPAPNTNQGVQNVPDSMTALDKRVFSDQELYEANRDKIMKMWYSGRRRG